jgi:hypothetical protein
LVRPSTGPLQQCGEHHRRQNVHLKQHQHQCSF